MERFASWDFLIGSHRKHNSSNKQRDYKGMPREYEVVEFEDDYIILNAMVDKNSFDLVCASNQIVSAPKRLLSKCAFFESLLNSYPDQQSLKMDASEEVMRAFLQFLGGNVPHPENAFDFVKFGVEIQFPAFIATCSLNAKTFQIPAEENLNSAIQVGKAFVSYLPLRQIKHYSYILTQVPKKWQDRQSEYIGAILDELRKKRHEPFQLPLIPLFEKKLTVAIMQFIPEGLTGLAAFVRDKWRLMTVLACGVDFQKTQISGFHLVFGKYFIYATEPTKKVYIKNLVTDGPAEVFCESFKIFRSHFGNLVVVTSEKGVDTIFVWSNEQNKFKNVFSNSSVKVRNVSWPRDSNNRMKDLYIVTERNQIIRINQQGHYKFFIQSSGKAIIDYVNEFHLLNDERSYTSSKDSSPFLQVRDVTFMGFTNISVEAVDADVGVYRTHTAGPESEAGFLHGKVHAISDVYLGIDHVDFDLRCKHL